MTSNFYLEVLHRVEANPHHLAVIQGPEWWTYEELDRQVRSLVAFLSDAGVQPGDYVLTCQPDAVSELKAILALAYMGATSISVHSSDAAARRESTARRYGADYIVSPESDPGVGGLEHITFPDVTARVEPKASQPTAIEPEHVVRVVRLPAAAQRGHRVKFSHGALLEGIRFLSDATVETSRVAVLELQSEIGVLSAIVGLCKGATLVMLAKRHPALDLHVRAVTELNLEPSLAQTLCEKLKPARGSYPLLKVQLLSADPEPHLLGMLQERLSSATEFTWKVPALGVLARAAPALLREKPLAAGRSLAGVDLRVVDEGGATLTAGELGLVQVKQQNEMGRTGQESAAISTSAGWADTGYRGWLDVDDILRIEGRESDFLEAGGNQFNPDLLEKILMMHPFVREAGVSVESGSEDTESRIIATVVSSENCLDELALHCKKLLGRHLPITFVAFPDELGDTGRFLRKR